MSAESSADKAEHKYREQVAITQVKEQPDNSKARALPKTLDKIGRNHNKTIQLKKHMERQLITLGFKPRRLKDNKI